jgi:hypothetical protein
MSTRYLMLALFALSSTVRAQTTTTTLPQNCGPATLAELQAAVANDPDWTAIMGYAKKHHFDVVNIPNPGIIKCTDSLGTAYVGQLFNLRKGQPNGQFEYSASFPTLRHTRFHWQKSPHVILDVTNVITTRTTLASDGTIRRAIFLDLKGHPIRFSTTTTTLAPATRGFL